MIVCRHWLGWLLSASGTARISSWKALLFVSSSWLSAPKALPGIRRSLSGRPQSLRHFRSA